MFPCIPTQTPPHNTQYTYACRDEGAPRFRGGQADPDQDGLPGIDGRPQRPELRQEAQVRQGIHSFPSPGTYVRFSSLVQWFIFNIISHHIVMFVIMLYLCAPFVLRVRMHLCLSMSVFYDLCRCRPIAMHFTQSVVDVDVSSCRSSSFITAIVILMRSFFTTHVPLGGSRNHSRQRGRVVSVC